MKIDLSLLDRAVEQNIRPCLITDGCLENVKHEGYHHQQLIPKIQAYLSQAALKEDVVKNVSRAIQQSTNLLTSFDVIPAIEFLKSQLPETIHQQVTSLLYGTEPLLKRAEVFHQWAKVAKLEDGKKRGINLTVVSYLLAMSDPQSYAFCKPDVYRLALTHLGGEPLGSPTPQRVVHTTEYYREALKLFQQRHKLPFTDLQHVHIAFYLLLKPYGSYPAWADLSAQVAQPSLVTTKQVPMQELNAILYGPPGTGKTFATSRIAVEICDGSAPEDHQQLMQRFAQLRSESRISFVTFHQAYSYEDFIEGLRPVLAEEESGVESESGQEIRYECRPGVFKQLCEFASVVPTKSGGGKSIDWQNVRVWKMSLGDTADPEEATIYEECLSEGVVRLGYGGDVDFSGCETRAQIDEALQKQFPDRNLTHVQMVDAIKNGMKMGDLIVITDGNRKFRGIGKVSGNYKLLDKQVYRQARPLEWLSILKESRPRELIYSKNFSQVSVYRLRDESLKLSGLQQFLTPVSKEQATNFVMIIDEINRGNVAKILGELITLLEPDKRLGGANELQVKLPYSGEWFGVPTNLYVVGTMNTADRSIAFLDVALRRRFKFIELMPDYDLIDEAWSESVDAGLLDLGTLLRVMNARIEFLYDRDHQIGHAFFLAATSLLEVRDVFCSKVIPLLQEYFYGDWSKVCQVLGCPVDLDTGKQTSSMPLIVAQSLKQLAGLTIDEEDKLSYTINPAFIRANSSEALVPFFSPLVPVSESAS